MSKVVPCSRCATRGATVAEDHAVCIVSKGTYHAQYLRHFQLSPCLLKRAVPLDEELVYTRVGHFHKTFKLQGSYFNTESVTGSYVPSFFESNV
jgi:hypothetical protein